MSKRVELERLRPPTGLKASRTALNIGLVVVIGISVGLAVMTLASTLYKNSLQTRINSVAESLDTTRVGVLASTPVEIESPAVNGAYTYLRAKLARIKAANPDSRFVYIMARNDKGEIYFVADSEPVDSKAYSPRGQIYPEASPKLKDLVDSGTSFVEGPSRDSYGTWLSALAPIVDDQSYRITAIVGMDVPSNNYAVLLALTGGIPLLLSLLAAAILYARYQSRRRHQENIQFRAEMISIASHELRTPLTGLRWSQESLLSHKLSPEAEKRSMEIMYDSTLRLQESIEDILQLASMEAGRYRLFEKDDDVREILKDIVSMQELAADRVNVGIQFAPEWPEELVLHCDKQRLKRVFHNLLSNSIKYSNPDTKIVIGYRRSDTGGHVISFQDHGIGIPQSEQAHVWDGFYRASNTAAHSITGTGMGLYLTRQIITQHGGKAWLESTEGVGTTVYVELPDSVAKEEATPPIQSKGK